MPARFLRRSCRTFASMMRRTMEEPRRAYNTQYEGAHLSRVAFPLGGIGAGMLCVEGSGALSHVSVRNAPDVFNEPMIFAAVKVLDHNKTARLLEGPVPEWKIFGGRGAGNGAGGRTYGFPRFDAACFEARFPFAGIELADQGIPLKCRLTAWSPFLPGNADDSSLPMAVLEYTFHNQTHEPLESVFSFHAANFMCTSSAGDSVGGIDHGFVLRQAGSDEMPSDEGAFSVTLPDSDVSVDCAWFRGGWFDAATMLWKHIDGGHVVTNPPPAEGAPSPGGSVYLPFSLQPGEQRTPTILLAWYVPTTTLRLGKEEEACCNGGRAGQGDTHVPWYAKRFATIESVTEYAQSNRKRLRQESIRFRDCFFDTTLPPEVIEAVAANLTILKSPTVLRQTDGRLWCWEGCGDAAGCCGGSCTHVWNYAQALPHLFPDLERTLRQSEFHESQDERGHQVFRTALPIRPQKHDGHAAADGQLGGIMKVYREWRISGDTDWLGKLWPRVRRSLDYCIEAWDPQELGVLVEPHHNTYDIEFWGPDGMCTSFYLGALRAATMMGEALGDDVSRYAELYARGRAYMEEKLFNGEYFIQDIQWTHLRAGDPTEAKALVNINWSPEAVELVRREGPKYQYGAGCLSDGVLGAWIAAACGIGEILDDEEVRSHLLAVYRHNLKRDLSAHANPQRPGYAVGKEGGLLLCTWPKGGELSLPFVYSNEAWTGIEYQAASHLMMMGCVAEGLEIVRVARSRYDGRVRNPFNEYECGHWYARALASYGLLQGLTGIRYDALSKTLYVEPRIEGDFRAFLCTATGYGTAGVGNGEPFLEVKHGTIVIGRLVYNPYCPEQDTGEQGAPADADKPRR